MQKRDTFVIIAFVLFLSTLAFSHGCKPEDTIYGEREVNGKLVCMCCGMTNCTCCGKAGKNKPTPSPTP